ncbi:hypothetical protein VTL71DRAFT_7597 [Oculimacula yallundae]|uniref:Transmembrane protein n=1 Tax=Oculimacula yallundae TaxID=86028 RepID=A0ABR4BW86_9HELO
MMNMLRMQQRAVGEQPINHVPAEIPRAGMVISTALTMLTISILAICFSRRIPSPSKELSKVPLTRWLILIIYADSILFIFVTAILQHGFGLNLNMSTCSAAILLCLVCYMTTKLIYYFLVEKVYIIRSISKPRLKSKLYLFNTFGMLLLYLGCIILNFVYRTAYFAEDGTCIIGMELKAMMPLIIFDAVVNLYLTLLFVLPLRSLYSYKNSPKSSLRTMAIRSFVGSIATLTSSVVNLTVLMVLQGEEAWLCLMLCNADILFSVVVLHWVTSKDTIREESTNLTSPGHTSRSRRQQRHDSEQIVFAGPCSPGPETTQPFDFVGNNGSVTTHITAEKPSYVLDTWQQNGLVMSDLESGGEERRKGGKSLKSNKSDKSHKASKSVGATQLVGRIEVQVGQTVETVRSGDRLSDNGCELIPDFRFSGISRLDLSTDNLVKKI